MRTHTIHSLHHFGYNHFQDNTVNIKRLTSCLLVACSLQANAQYLEHIYDYIENTSVFEENQEEGHAYYLAEQHLSLNGDWRYFFADTPEEVPQNFFATNFKDGKWRTIHVPSNWEMEGYGPMCQENTPPLAHIGNRSTSPRPGKGSRYSCEWRRRKAPRSYGSMASRWDIMKEDRNLPSMM